MLLYRQWEMATTTRVLFIIVLQFLNIWEQFHDVQIVESKFWLNWLGLWNFYERKSWFEEKRRGKKNERDERIE